MKIFKHWQYKNLSVYTRANTGQKHRSSWLPSMWPPFPPASALRRYASPTPTRMRIVTNGARTIVKSWKTLRKLIFRYTKPWSSDMYVQLTIARTTSTIARPAMVTASCTTYQRMSKQLCSQKKTHIFEPTDPNSVLEFVATSKLACGANSILESAAL